MNYYERHIGDYLKDTAHLSLLEHGVYTRLMDVYYTRESAIPEREAARLIGARSKDEREAMQAVLSEFFVLIDGAWNQKRCEEELMAYRESQEGAEDKKANDKERQRRARERRKALFDQLRSHGVVAPWDTKTVDLQQMLSRVTQTPASAPVTQPVTRDNTATQTPDTRHQTPEEIQAGAKSTDAVAPALPEPDLTGHQPTPAGLACRAMKAAGLNSVNPGDPRLLELLRQGATVEEFAGMAAEAVAKSPPKGFAWVLAALQGRRSEASAITLAKAADKPNVWAGAV